MAGATRPSRRTGPSGSRWPASRCSSWCSPLIARPGARAIAGSAVLVLLTSLMQSLLAGLADNHAVYGALHALDGLLILGIAGYLYARSRRRET